MMHLTHRNRVAYSRLNRLEIQRCGQTCLQVSSHSGEGSFAALFGLSYKMKIY